ncbi:MAG: FG-GAP repeat protein [Saprospiraceae bacterium]
MKKIPTLHLLFLISFFYVSNAISQAVGVGTNAPASSSIIDIQSTAKGALLPRMTTMQRKAIVGPVTGLMVFDLDKQAIYIYDGAKWGALLMTYSDSRLPGIPQEASDGAADDQFGYTVSITGNYAIIGAYKKDVSGNPNQGGAYIFFRNNSVWTQQAILTSSDGAAEDYFGGSVDMGTNADYAIVGARQATVGANAQQGAAYIFSRSGSTWTQLAKLTASDGAAGNLFGCSVSLDGDYAVIGSTGAGAAYVFYRGGGWMSGQSFQAKLAPTGGMSAAFGFDVSISVDQLIVGSPFASSFNGACSIYARMGTVWTLQSVNSGSAVSQFGTSVSIDGDYATSSMPGFNSSKGSVLVYFKGTGWTNNQTAQATLTAQDGVNGDYFGNDISLSADQLLIGAYQHDLTLNGNQGAAYLFKRSNTTWSFQRKSSDESAQFGENFGSAVGISGFNMIFGIPLKNNTKGEIQMINIE